MPQAERRLAENLLVIRDKALVAKCTANWQAHVEHSEPYTGRGADEAKPARKRKAA
jgi:hypothetical protein